MTGLRFSTQASATWLGDAPSFFAMLSSTEPGFASTPAASGYHGMKTDILFGAMVEHVLALAIDQVVFILHRRDRERISALP